MCGTLRGTSTADARHTPPLCSLSRAQVLDYCADGFDALEECLKRELDEDKVPLVSLGVDALFSRIERNAHEVRGSGGQGDRPRVGRYARGVRGGGRRGGREGTRAGQFSRAFKIGWARAAPGGASCRGGRAGVGGGGGEGLPHLRGWMRSHARARCLEAW